MRPASGPKGAKRRPRRSEKSKFFILLGIYLVAVAVSHGDIPLQRFALVSLSSGPTRDRRRGATHTKKKWTYSSRGEQMV